MTPLEAVFFGVVAICAFVGAAWLHEATHAAAAQALGGEVLEIDWIGLFVYFKFDPEAPVRERLVLLAPAIVGFAISPILLLSWDGDAGVTTAIVVVSWVIYSLNGGVDGELSLSGV